MQSKKHLTNVQYAYAFNEFNLYLYNHQ